MTTIRAATPEDLPTLLVFEQAIVAAEKPYDVTLRDAGVHYYDIAAMLTAPEVRFLVAQSGDELVGCGFVRIEPAKPYLKHPRHGYLGLMYVTDSHRGRGVNGRIIDALKAWCCARGIFELRLDVYAGNTQAVRAYQKAGFAGLLLEMRLELGP